MKTILQFSKAIVYTEDMQFLLIQRSSTAKYHPNKWSIPGGNREDGEDFEQTCIRETKEETGLDVSIEQFHRVQSFSVKEAGKVGVIAEFLCKSESTNVVLSNEHQAYKWVSLEEFQEVVTLKNEAIAFLKR